MGAGSRRGRLAGLVLLTLACAGAAGCELRGGLDVAVRGDGSGTVTVSLTADAELLAEADEAGVDPLGDLAQIGDDPAVAAWAVTEGVDADGARTVTLSAPFDGPEAFDTLTEDLAAGLAAPEVTVVEDLRLRLDEETITFAGVAGLQPTDAVADVGLDPDEFVALLDDSTVYTVSVRLPDEVVEASAPAEDGRVTWQVPAGERVDLLAVGTRPRAPVWPAAAGVVAALLVVAWLIAWRRGGRGPDAARQAGVPGAT